MKTHTRSGSVTMDNTCHSNNNQRDGAESALAFNTLASVAVCQADGALLGPLGTRKSNQLSLHV
jgi:hypothetical protein